MANLVLLRPALPVSADLQHECTLRREAAALATQLPKNTEDAAKVLAYMSAMLAFVTCD